MTDPQGMRPRGTAIPPGVSRPEIPTPGQGAPAKSGDPLQDLLNKQEETDEKAGKALEDAFKK